MMDATELAPGLWSLSVGSVQPLYARVQLVRRGDQLGYRAERHDGALIGYYLNFRSACLHAQGPAPSALTQRPARGR